MSLRTRLHRSAPTPGATAPTPSSSRRFARWHSDSIARTGVAVLGIVAIGAISVLAVEEHNPTAVHRVNGPQAVAGWNALDGHERDHVPALHSRPAGTPKPAPTATPSHAATALVPPSSGQAPIRRAATVVRSGLPHVMVIMEENKGYAATLGSCASDPYYCSLASTYATDTSWFGIGHPSAPNYIGIASGGMQGVTSDCTPPACGPFGAPSLGGQLTAAGIPWRAYMESMPSPCYASGSSGLYAEKHNPFLYFNDVRAAANCASVEQPYPGAAGLVSALNGPGAPDFVWITPNLANDMHDGSVQQGDAWLSANLAPVLASPWFTGGNATVIVTMDEGPSGNQIPMVVISSNAKRKGPVATPGNHYGTLGSIERAYGLGLLGAAGSSSSGDLVSLFGGPK